MAEFVGTEAFDATHPEALALYCSDGRFTNSVEELLHRLGHPRLDTITLPGGPGLFNAWLAGLTDSQAVLGGSNFLITSHRIRRVVLLAHAQCGFYARRMPSASVDEIQRQQVADLQLAASLLVERHAGIDVSAYYAVAEQRVRFHPVALGTVRGGRQA